MSKLTIAWLIVAVLLGLGHGTLGLLRDLFRLAVDPAPDPWPQKA